MRVLIYVGPAPSRAAVLAASRPIVERAASSVTLVAGADQQHLLADAAARLGVLPTPVVTRALPGNAQQVILAAATEAPFDLVVLGRLNLPLVRRLPGARPRSRAIAQRLEPSVLRVHGDPRPPRRILLASGGDHHTFRTARVVAQLAAPLGASVTLLHIVSQQSLVFEGFGGRRVSVGEFLAGPSPEADTLRQAAAQLEQAGVRAEVHGRSGPVVDEILSELRAGDFDMLAIGAHRVASALDRILLEDLSGDLLDVAPVSTLVVKGDEAG